MVFEANEKVLNKYADLLINMALGSGEGIKKDDVVWVRVPESARPMLQPLQRAVLQSGGHTITQLIPDGDSREFFETASDEQLDFFADKYYRGIVDQVDHMVYVFAEADKHELEGIPGEKIMRKSRSLKPYMDWRRDKEAEGKFTWTLGMYPTEAMAAEVGMSIDEYWNEIVKGCWLDVDDPKQKWREIMGEVERVKDSLDALAIESLRIEAENTDLTIKLGANRKWLGGSGRNIPSYEVFISPDWRGTEGHIQFTEPLYRYGNLIEDVYLEFKEGLVVKASASKGEDVLKAMIAEENADKVGEYSLTDSRISRITRFMGETLFDENVGGKFGNTHLALGSAYKDSYPGDASKVPKEDWDKMGYNDSSVHTDIVATSNRTVTATLSDGTERVIYKDGQFLI